MPFPDLLSSFIPPVVFFSQLMGAQGTETIRDFCANPCRPKVSLKEFSTAMNPGNLEPRTVNLQFAECLCLVRCSVVFSCPPYVRNSE